METLMSEPAKPVSPVLLTIAQWPVKILNIIILAPFSSRTTTKQQSYSNPTILHAHDSQFGTSDLLSSIPTTNTELLSRICLQRTRRSVEIKSGN
jgi:hypothetical protein